VSYTTINGLRLRRGSLYEFRKKISMGGLFSSSRYHNNLLGAYRGAQGRIAYFSIVADSDPGKWHYSNMGVGLREFEFLKQVPIEDLPLYVGWPWKTHFFTEYLKKGLKK
jgi:hypothetical protein